MEERKASNSGTEEIRVGVNAEMVMSGGRQCQEIRENERFGYAVRSGQRTYRLFNGGMLGYILLPRPWQPEGLMPRALALITTRPMLHPLHFTVCGRPTR
jgi:hypothetical protein